MDGSGLISPSSCLGQEAGDYVIVGSFERPADRSETAAGALRRLRQERLSLATSWRSPSPAHTQLWR
jgi:hypothetical protein